MGIIESIATMIAVNVNSLGGYAQTQKESVKNVALHGSIIPVQKSSVQIHSFSEPTDAVMNAVIRHHGRPARLNVPNAAASVSVLITVLVTLVSYATVHWKMRLCGAWTKPRVQNVVGEPQHIPMMVCVFVGRLKKNGTAPAVLLRA